MPVAIWVSRRRRQTPYSKKGKAMARTPQNTTPAPEAVQEATPGVVSTNGTSDGFDWSALDAPIVMPSKTVATAITANVLETVPEQIRSRAEASLTHNAAAKAAKATSTAKRARVIYHWDFQPVKDEKMAAAFDRLITKYAKYRPDIDNVPFADAKSPRGQVTARTGNPGWFARTAEGEFTPCKSDSEGAMYGLRYSVRPFEQRSDTSRLPGTE